MKRTILYSLIAAAAACGISLGQVYTTPVGYTTETLETGFNLIGISLHNPTVAIGTITAVDSDSITDSNATLTTALAAGTYLLEISDGLQGGALQVFSNFTDTTITTDDDLQAAGVVAGDGYSIRAVATISSVFGPNNESGLQASDSPVNADIIWVPNGVGGYFQYYRNQGLVIGETVIAPPSWRTVAGVEAGNQPLVFSDGMFIQRKGASLDLVISGEVKLTSTRVPVPNGFSIVASGFPVGTTLDNSGLQDHITQSDSPVNADIIWMPTGPGTYAQFYYNQGLVIGETVIAPPSWRTVSGVPAGSTALESAVFIQRKGTTTDAVISPGY